MEDVPDDEACRHSGRACVLLCPLDRGRSDIDPGDVITLSRQVDGRGAGAAADLEHSPAARAAQPGHDVVELGEVLGQRIPCIPPAGSLDTAKGGVPLFVEPLVLDAHRVELLT